MAFNASHYLITLQLFKASLADRFLKFVVVARNIRHVSDLPASGRLVRLHVVTRRFCCEAPQCPRQLFADHFDETVIPVRSLRTARLEGLIHHLVPTIYGTRVG
jgi:hypothetical protein